MLTYISSEGDHSLCVLSRFALHGLKFYCTACSRSSLEMNRSWHYYSELSYCTNRYKYRMQDEKKLNIFRVVISEVSCLCKFSRQRFFISNCYKIRCGSSNEKKERRRQLISITCSRGNSCSNRVSCFWTRNPEQERTQVPRNRVNSWKNK